MSPVDLKYHFFSTHSQHTHRGRHVLVEAGPLKPVGRGIYHPDSRRIYVRLVYSLCSSLHIIQTFKTAFKKDTQCAVELKVKKCFLEIRTALKVMSGAHELIIK